MEYVAVRSDDELNDRLRKRKTSTLGPCVA